MSQLLELLSCSLGYQLALALVLQVHLAFDEGEGFLGAFGHDGLGSRVAEVLVRVREQRVVVSYGCDLGLKEWVCWLSWAVLAGVAVQGGECLLECSLLTSAQGLLDDPDAWLPISVQLLAHVEEGEGRWSICLEEIGVEGRVDIVSLHIL